MTRQVMTGDEGKRADEVHPVVSEQELKIPNGKGGTASGAAEPVQSGVWRNLWSYEGEWPDMTNIGPGKWLSPSQHPTESRARERAFVSMCLLNERGATGIHYLGPLFFPATEGAA